MTTDTSAVSAVAAELHDHLPEQRILSGLAYERSRRIWNGAVGHAPALIVRPETAGEVQTAVAAARRHGLPLSVRGGGHDWAGRSLRDGGLVIDLSQMRQVAVDSRERIATVQGGATAGDVVVAAQPHGLAAATGTTGGVGMAGLTLGGGYGPLNGRFGLAVDNLLGAEVVLADGRRVTAKPDREPDLFWALRGGGGNFGVVTSMRVRLHPVSDVLAGFIVYPWAQATDVWKQLNVILADGPDEMTVQTGILPGPDGTPAVFLSPVWSGDLTRGGSVIDELLRLGTPLDSQVAAMSYADMLSLFDAQIVTGRHYALRTRTVAKYTPEVIAALVEAGESQTSVLSGIFIHHFHGAASRIPIDATAFGIRRAHYVVEILAAWQPDQDGTRHRRWANTVAANLAEHALPGGYANLLGPDDHEQIAHAYGGNATLLRAAKKHLDPDGVFSAIPLPPESGV
ncbi:MAG TPA: FAD-binding oxidoreductase [Mycobacterium sp.]|nr:FAD-binding oxidoreductase [Mycobacterium sp.]